jgi:hypothetical protein
MGRPMSKDLGANLTTESPPASEGRPSEVLTALQLASAALVLGLVQVGVGMDQALSQIREAYSSVEVLAAVPDSTWRAAIWATSLAGVSLHALVLTGIYFRKNWARWIYSGFVVLGVLGFLVATLLGAERGVLVNGIRSIQTALTVVALSFLLREKAKVWFRSTT